jgi:hypothetical protein
MIKASRLTIPAVIVELAAVAPLTEQGMCVINANPDDDTAGLPEDRPVPVQRRAKLMNDAIHFAVGSAICTTRLLIIAFVSALLSLRHEPGGGVDVRAVADLDVRVAGHARARRHFACRRHAACADRRRWLA